MQLKFSNKNSKIFKALGISISIIILFVLLEIIYAPPLKYNFSIYDNISDFSFLLLTSSLVIGILLVIYNINYKSNNFKFLYLGLSLIIICNSLILLFPNILGYSLPDFQDHATHIGYVRDIIINSKIGSENVYPIIHLLTAEISFFTGISFISVGNYIPIIFYLLNGIFIYCLCKYIMPKKAALMAYVAATIPYCYFYYEIFPMGYGFIIFPLIFYIYIYYKKVGGLSPLLILFTLIILIPITHPVAGAILVIALSTLEMSGFLLFKFNKVNKKAIDHNITKDIRFGLTIPLISSVALILWIGERFYVWKNSITSVLSWITGELLTTPITDKAIYSFSILNLSSLDIGKLFVIMYGHYFIYFIISLYAIFLIFKSLKLRELQFLKIFSCFFIPASFLWIIDYFRPLTGLSSGRLIWLMTPLFPILVGFGLYHIIIIYNSINNIFKVNLIKKYSRILITSFVAFLLVNTSIIAIVSVYPSPITYRTNIAVDQKVIIGGFWLLENGNSDNDVISLEYYTPPIYRYANLYYGFNFLDYPPTSSTIIPDHFNYSNELILNNSINNNHYIISRMNMTIDLYKDMYKNINRFSNRDFNRLMNDPSVNKIYTNNDMETWIII